METEGKFYEVTLKATVEKKVLILASSKREAIDEAKEGRGEGNDCEIDSLEWNVVGNSVKELV